MQYSNTLILDQLLHYDLLLCATEGSLAPMDDFLRASLPAAIMPLVMTHLPELDVSQPDKVSCDCLLLIKSSAALCLPTLNYCLSVSTTWEIYDLLLTSSKPSVCKDKQD